MNPVILIPARMSSTRLPGKPLAPIAGRPMIAHVLERARAAGIGPAYVATDAPEIEAFLASEGTQAAMTSPAHASGSDRIHEALEALDPEKKHDVVVNLQGDLPLIEPEAIAAVLAPLEDPAVDIATLAAEIHDERERDDPNVVKAVGTPVGPRRLRALYFTRATAPSGEGPLLHHIGIYAYRRAALSRFVALPEGALEKRERLEQLRALEAGMRIDIGLVDAVPFGVDTPADLERARAAMAASRPERRP